MHSRPRHRLAATVTALVLALPVGVLAVAVPASAASDPCAVGGNPIVCENSKPGTDPAVWDIQGAGDESIQGFATAISVNVGGTIDFKIDTAATAYTIDIYRTGWYDGLGARKVDSVTPSATLPQVQPQCVSDAATEIYDCGNWAVSASWHVPTTAVSGVYLANLRDPATGAQSHITFVVRDDASTSDLIFQTSDTTWQAYNAYGGSDYYQGAANGRAYKISYNRPFATRAGVEARDFYFGNEFPMVRFLERNGYDVSYQSGLDTDARGDLLLNHRVFLSVGHDEYWSGPQRANVEAARDAGVNLAFFSGNEMYWRTRWEPSVAGTPTADRTLVSYKETWGDAKIDPSPEWTGTSRDPRFASAANGGGSPENAVTGTMYMANDSDLALTVSAEEGKLRLWRGTTLTSMAAGTTTSLAAHTVGYESDEDLDNGFRPQGLIRLSTTTGAVNSYLQDFGTVVKSGTTTHHLTMYRAASGALVFSAGTIQWSWGLDAVHDGNGAPADPRIQQATVNLLADMGTQPSTLMSTLVGATASTDVTGPVVTVTSPTEGAALPNGTSVTVTGTATDAGGRVGGVEVSVDGGTSWHPATGTSTWTYTAVLSGNGAVPILARGIDDSANIGQAVTRTVATACPCSVYGQSVPVVAAVDDSSAVELGLRFTPQVSGFVTAIRFYKGTGNGGTHQGRLWSAAGATLASVTFVDESATGWQTAQLSAPVAVQAGTTYVVSYTAPQGRYAAQSGAFWYTGREASPLSVAGGFGAPASGVYANAGQFPTLSWGASQYYVDVLFSPSDSTPFTVTSRWPVPGATGTALGSVVTAQLSRAPDGGQAAITVTDAAGTDLPGSTGYDAATRTATFVPDGSLSPSTTYTAAVQATASGQPLGGQTSWTFTSAAATQTLGASSVTLYDESAVPGVLQDADTSPVTLGVRFSSSVAGYVTGVRFYKGPNNTGTHVGALWLAGSSTPLATATFKDESASGWQTVTFGSPVHIDKDTAYIASYRASAGRYSATVGAFSGLGVQRPPLSTFTDSGAYTYADGYPGSTSSTSYMVDVVFTRDRTALTTTALSPAAGQTAVDVDTGVSASFNLALTGASTLSLSAGGTAVAGALTRADGGATLTFTPSSRCRRARWSPPRRRGWPPATARRRRTCSGASPPPAPAAARAPCSASAYPPWPRPPTVRASSSASRSSHRSPGRSPACGSTRVRPTPARTRARCGARRAPRCAP
ncbi:N,N-dimethylformamidase beta subunit family domain-containing protein [Cellulomonas soli]